MSIPKIKGWCPSLEKPMETGDGLLVRIPIRFGQVNSDMLRKFAVLSMKYGNGHLDLSARGNLQFRGVSQQAYEPLRKELAQLGIKKDFSFQIIASPLDENSQQMVEKLYAALCDAGAEFPEKFLIVIDAGGVFPLAALPCDLYIPLQQFDLERIISILKNMKKCNKKSADINAPTAPIGFVPHKEQLGIVSVAAEFGRIEAEELIKMADISEKYSNGEVVFAPFRRVIFPDILREKARQVLQELAEVGFITKADDSRLKIHACVGAPACSSALGETRQFARKWANDNPTLDKIVHITGCSKGCAYKGKADITITATKAGYETN